MLKRKLQHQIDTKAIRKILSQLDEDWLVRNLSERDYGIDLTLERFDGENATGDFILVQVKGTDSEFGNEVKLSKFPTKTIQYSLLFNVPFFVFYTSNATGKTLFVWLQKYADLKLPRTTPGWETQDTVTIYFPEVNDIAKNKDKLIDIIDKDKSKRIGVKYLSLYESLKIHSESVLLGEFSIGEYCYKACQSIYNMRSFISRYSINIPDGSNINILNLGDAYRDISKTQNISTDNKDFINKQMEYLEQVKQAFLGDDEFDDFAVEMHAYESY